MIVYILIGLPGSGKSTWTKEKVKENEHCVVVSRDSFRNMIKGDEYTFNFRYEPFIKDSTSKTIQSALKHGLDVIVDETHIKADRRKEIIKTVREYEESYGLINDNYGRTKIVYVWFTETEKNLDNRMNEARGYNRSKWEMVINGMKKSFEKPTDEEEYDELVEINPFKGD
jgi:tRNA uridine 5-carbamoylmethylation protein Kti12